MNFGTNLKALRERIGLSQREMGEIIQVNDTLYSRYEKEIQIIPIKHLNTLCNYFDVSLDYIFNLSEKKKYTNYKKEINNIEMGKRIKEIRKENKLTQMKLAEILNIANGTIAEYELGNHLIATPFLYTICNKYKISADYLLGKTDSPKYLK